MNIFLQICSIFILFIIIGSLIIFHLKFITQLDSHSFMKELEEKLENKGIDRETKEVIIDEFGKLFNHQNLVPAFVLLCIISYFNILAILTSVILQFCNKLNHRDKKCKNFFIAFLPFYSLPNMFFYYAFAFYSNYKLDLSEKYIYMFDDEFNQEIKNNLDFMYKRRIYLITCFF